MYTHLNRHTGHNHRHTTRHYRCHRDGPLTDCTHTQKAIDTHTYRTHNHTRPYTINATYTQPWTDQPMTTNKPQIHTTAERHMNTNSYRYTNTTNTLPQTHEQTLPLTGTLTKPLTNTEMHTTSDSWWLSHHGLHHWWNHCCASSSSGSSSGSGSSSSRTPAHPQSWWTLYEIPQWKNKKDGYTQS